MTTAIDYDNETVLIPLKHYTELEALTRQENNNAPNLKRIRTLLNMPTQKNNTNRSVTTDYFAIYMRDLDHKPNQAITDQVAAVLFGEKNQVHAIDAIELALDINESWEQHQQFIKLANQYKSIKNINDSITTTKKNFRKIVKNTPSAC